MQATGHPRHQIAPSSGGTGWDVEKLMEKFRRIVGAEELSDLAYAKHFYSKTKCILNLDQPCCENTAEVCLMLLCESILLFEREFSLFSGKRTFDSYKRNRKFFRGKSGVISNKTAIRWVCGDFPSLRDNQALLIALQKHHERAQKAKSTLKQLYSMELSHDGLTDTEYECFRTQVWPSYCRYRKSISWIQENKAHYRRHISGFHILDFEQYEEKRESLEGWNIKLKQWQAARRVYVGPAKDASSCEIVNKKCTELLRQLGARDRNVETDFKSVLRKLMQVYSKPTENSVFEMYCVLCRTQNLHRSHTLKTQIARADLFLRVLDAFSDQLTDSEKTSTTQAFWEGANYHEKFPKLDFFRGIAKMCPDHLMNMMYPFHLGIHISKLLDECVRHYPEALSHKSIYMANADTLGRYKSLYPEKYEELTVRVSKNRDRIDGYQELWDCPDIRTDERAEYLKTRIRNLQIDIPDDDRLWEGYQGARTSSHMQKEKRYLRMLLLENAIQDCIRERAKQKLYEFFIGCI